MSPTFVITEKAGLRPNIAVRRNGYGASLGVLTRSWSLAWWGFLPTISNGCASIALKDRGRTAATLFGADCKWIGSSCAPMHRARYCHADGQTHGRRLSKCGWLKGRGRPEAFHLGRIRLATAGCSERSDNGGIARKA